MALGRSEKTKNQQTFAKRDVAGTCTGFPAWHDLLNCSICAA
jgi:hypothetical protein